MIVVCDASPIIALSSISKLPLLEQLYGEILIPESVAHEVAHGGVERLESSPWINIRPIGDSVLLRALYGELDRGEAEAICLAVEVRAGLLLVDERRARKVASRLGLPIVGVLGVLIEAKGRGLISKVCPLLDDLLVKVGFRVDPDLYLRVIRSVGEEDEP